MYNLYNPNEPKLSGQSRNIQQSSYKHMWYKANCIWSYIKLYTKGCCRLLYFSWYSGGPKQQKQTVDTQARPLNSNTSSEMDRSSRWAQRQQVIFIAWALLWQACEDLNSTHQQKATSSIGVISMIHVCLWYWRGIHQIKKRNIRNYPQRKSLLIVGLKVTVTRQRTGQSCCSDLQTHPPGNTQNKTKQHNTNWGWWACIYTATTNAFAPTSSL